MKGHRLVVAALAAVSLALLHPALASLPFDVSYPRQCTPLNVTWTPTSAGYPYTVYILAVGGAILSYTINEDYQPKAEKLTFQYLVPPPSSTFSTFVVAITDNQGNGNSSNVLPVNTGGNSSSSCSAFTGTTQWTYAADSITDTVGDRPQCGTIRYYPVDPPFRGTRPFSITLVPLGETPITVSIPQSSTQNQSYFIYESPVPFKTGTQFYQFLSDAQGGGSGGGSLIYTVSGGSNTTCLQSSYELPDLNTSRAMPTGLTTATFSNLAGALTDAEGASSGSSSSGGSSGSGSGTNVGGLVGGIIGAVVGVGAILLLVALFLLYRRRQKRRREAARKEEPQFVDLDGDDDAEGLQPPRRRRQSQGISQSYNVSPFTYEQAASHSPEPQEGERGPSNSYYYDQPSAASGGFAPYSSYSRPGSISQSAYDGRQQDMPPVSPGSGYPPAPASLHPSMNAPNTAYTATSNGGGSTHGVGSEPSEFGAYPSGPGSVSNQGSYRLRTRNETAAGSTSGTEAGPLPQKGQLSEELAHDSAHRPYMMHADAGPVPQTGRIGHDDVEELPPNYGEWTGGQSSSSTTAAGAAPSRQQ